MNKRHQQALVNILKNTGLNSKFQRFVKTLSSGQSRSYMDAAEDCFVLSRISQNLEGSDIDKYKASQKMWLSYLIKNDYEPFKPYFKKYGRDKVKEAIIWMIDNYKWESPIWNDSIGRISTFTWDYLKCIDTAVEEIENNPVVESTIVEDVVEEVKQEEEQHDDVISVDDARNAYDSLDLAFANIKNQMLVLGDFLMQDIGAGADTIKEKEDLINEQNELIEQLEDANANLRSEIEGYKQRVNELEDEVLRYVSELDKERNKPKPIRLIPYSDLTSLPLIGEKAASVLIPFFEKRLNVKFEMNK